MDEGVVDADFLKEVVVRKGALTTLAENPRHRSELQEELDISKSTCHRMVRSFEERNLVRRTDNGYTLTEFGRVVSEEVNRFSTNVGAAHKLEPLLASFASAKVEFDIELFTDAEVTRAQPNDPFPPISRFMELVQESGTLRSLDRTSIAPLYVEELFDLYFENEVTVQAIYPRSVVEKLVSEYTELHRQAVPHGRLEYRVYDGLPFGMSLFEDHVGLRAYDPDSGALLLFADTDDPEAVAWANAVFEHYREQSDPLSAFDSFPDWMTETESS